MPLPVTRLVIVLPLSKTNNEVYLPAQIALLSLFDPRDAIFRRTPFRSGFLLSACTVFGKSWSRTRSLTLDRVMFRSDPDKISWMRPAILAEAPFQVEFRFAASDLADTSYMSCLAGDLLWFLRREVGIVLRLETSELAEALRVKMASRGWAFGGRDLGRASLRFEPYLH